MIIDLTEIYKGLKEWRHERDITLENQKKDYIVNVMREFGKLSQALRDYEKIKNGERVIRAGTFDIKSTLGEMIIFEGTTKGELEISLENFSIKSFYIIVIYYAVNLIICIRSLEQLNNLIFIPSTIFI